jgi:hypothetical protein
MQTLIGAFSGVVNQLILLTAGVALLLFFWGLAIFIFQSGDPASHEEGKNKMIWGLVALFVMVSVWGLVGFIRSGLGFGPSQVIHNTIYGSNV